MPSERQRTNAILEAASARGVSDGTLCRQPSPLPGTLGGDLARAEAKRLGTPYAVSELWAVRNAVEHLHREFDTRIRVATSLHEVACLELEWRSYRRRFEALLGRSIATGKELPGDTQVREAVLDAFDLNLVGDVLREVVKEVMKAELPEATDVAVRTLAVEIVGQLRDILVDVAAARLLAAIGIADRRMVGTYLKNNLQVDWLEFAIHASNRRTSFSGLLAKTLAKVGLSVSDSKLRAIARAILERIADPTRLLPTALGKVAKKFGGAALAGLNVFFTPSRIASSSDDVLGAQVDQIEAMIERARARLSGAEFIAAPGRAR